MYLTTLTQWVGRRLSGCSASSEVAARHPHTAVGCFFLAAVARRRARYAGTRGQYPRVQRREPLGGCDEAQPWTRGLPRRSTAAAARVDRQWLRGIADPR